MTISYRRDKAIKDFLRKYFEHRNGDGIVRTVSINGNGAVVYFRIPVGTYGQRKIFLSTNTIEKIQEEAIRV